MRHGIVLVAAQLVFGAVAARAGVTLLLEEPFGNFGALNPTGHAAIYLSHICAASPLSLRKCHEGERGVVISRYHQISGNDWIAIPLVPYLYAVEQPEQVPRSVSPEEAASLRDSYRRAHLRALAPDGPGGAAPGGDWVQLVGEAYYRTIYAFGVETTPEHDERFIEAFNAAPNENRFNLLFHNCADFARHVVDFYFPRAVHRSLIADVGIMTPKQAAESLISYTRHHRDLQFSSFVIPQVPGTVPRSTAVRGVLESLMKSKKYALPLLPLAALHPFVGGSFAIACLEGSRSDPVRVAEAAERPAGPAALTAELQSNRVISMRHGE